MKIEKIKPIPKYIIALIKKEDKKYYKTPSGHTRYYSYLTKNDGELVKVTVAVRNRYNKWYCKQVAVHGVHSDSCFVKDMIYYYICGYVTGWYSEGIGQCRKWYEYGEWGWTDDNMFDPYAPTVNREYALKFPEYKYSAIELYNGANVIKYLRLYEKYPQLEYLMKLRLTDFHNSVQILRQIGKDKKFCKWLIKNKDVLLSKRFYIDVVLRAYKTGRNIRELQDIKEYKLLMAHDKSLHFLKGLFRGGELERLFLYVSKQNTTLQVYKDYYNACVELGLDMNEAKNRYPHDFKFWHDVRIDQYAGKKAELDARKREEHYKRFALIAEKYLALEKQNGREYVAIIAHSPAELIREGDILHHCVGRMNYDQKFVKEETLIFFIRLKSDMTTPLVTVEYSVKNHKVLQCYAEHNHTPDEKIMHFVNKIWLPHANRQIKAIAA